MSATIKGTGASTLPEATLATPLAVASGGTGVAVSNTIIQSVRTDDGVYATGTTAIPDDDTIPQITEGDEYMTVSITPTSATNKLIIEVGIGVFGMSATSQLPVMALFQDSIANALTAAAMTTNNATIQGGGVGMSYEMVAGTTSSTTFRLRAGLNTGTFKFNGGSAQKFGGVANSYIKVTEVTP